MKKIHEGCLAIYISQPGDTKMPPEYPQNDGKVLRVGQCIGFRSEAPAKDVYWKVSQDILYTKKGGIIALPLAAESRLEPIDEDDNDTKQIKRINRKFELLCDKLEKLERSLTE